MTAAHDFLSAEQFAAGTAHKGTDIMYGDPLVICRFASGEVLTGEVDEQPEGSCVGFLYINQGAAALITDGPFKEDGHTLLDAINPTDLERREKRYSLLWAPQTHICAYTRGVPGFVAIKVDDLKVGWLVMVSKTGEVMVDGYTQDGKHEVREGLHLGE